MCHMWARGDDATPCWHTLLKWLSSLQVEAYGSYSSGLMQDRRRWIAQTDAFKSCENHCSDIWAVTEEVSSPFTQNRREYEHGPPNTVSTAKGKQSLDPADFTLNISFLVDDIWSRGCVGISPRLLRKFHHDLISSVTFNSSVILTH